MLIWLAILEDDDAIWAIPEPAFRAGKSHPIHHPRLRPLCDDPQAVAAMREPARNQPAMAETTAWARPARPNGLKSLR